MYSHIIGVNDDLWDIIDDGVTFPVGFEGIMVDKKSLTEAQRKIYKKHHKVCGILVEVLPHSKYTKIVDKFTYKATFESLCSNYEGNQQVKEDKANNLVYQYEGFIMKEYEDIETICSQGFKFLYLTFRL